MYIHIIVKVLVYSSREGRIHTYNNSSIALVCIIHTYIRQYCMYGDNDQSPEYWTAALPIVFYNYTEN